MDTFDSVTLSVFLLLLSAVAARLTFWKAGGQLLSLRVMLCPVLLVAFALLSLSAHHHWNAPHRRAYQFLLAISGLAVSAWQIAMIFRRPGQAAGVKKAKGIYRR